MPTDSMGVFGQALKLRELRSSMIASNIVNASTPGYKAKDFDFNTAMKQAVENNKSGNTQNLNNVSIGEHLKYRIPNQPAIDGNTVDSEFEVSAYTENALQYQASLSFLKGHTNSIIKAIKGE